MRKISESKSWKQLNEVLSSLTTSKKSKEAGDIFEHVCKYYLETAPQYQSKLKKVWLLKEVKEDLKRKLNLPDTDEGIDLIAETYDKEYWAIQSKYRSNPQDTLTIKGDLATFANLAFNNCKHIVHGLVLTTSDKPPLKTKLLKGVGFETLESFVSLDDNNYEGWKLISAKATGKTVIPKALSPRPHQTEAIKKTIEHFKTKERGKMIMPCGTGKSLTAFWIARQLNAKSILIAVPSLALLQQTLKVWTREYLIAGIRPDWLCVCSDQTVSDDQDDFVSNIYEMGIDVTNETKKINKFLKKNNKNIKIVFTTYQSGKITSKGAKGFKFDLGIMDEAHKTVGHGEKPMAHLIHQKNIKIKNRLFMTATERLFRGDKDEYVSMDDPRDYGDIIYQLSFKAAIEMKPPIISDYKIITFGITAPEIEAVYNDNKFIQVKKEIDNITAREFATAIALRKAIRKLGIRNAISFHSSIKRANNFKKQQELISKVYKQYGTLKSFHVSGAMPTSQRASQMREFAEGKGLMTNARCLTEGVDLPAIDCVVFTDPKRSKVDIVQAAGRALRLSKGKKFGYILIPILISEDENATEAAKDTAFEDIVATVRALATQDTRIIDYLRAVSSGTIPRGGSPIKELTKLNVLTKVNEEEFNKSIQLKVWDKVAFGNWRSYEEAKKYAQSLNLKDGKDWVKHTKSKDFTKDIPVYLSQYYKEKWEGMTIFLGNEIPKYEEAKKILKPFNIKSLNEFFEMHKKNKLPRNIVQTPHRVYKNLGWKSWSDFLGNFIRSKNRQYASYDDYKKYIQKNNIKTNDEFRQFINSKNFKLNLYPKAPWEIYKEWKGFRDFFGTDFYSYDEHKKLCQKHKIKTSGQWINLIKNKKLKKYTTAPDAMFLKTGEWKSWGEFCGIGRIGEYLPYKEAKKWAQSLKLKSKKDWNKYVKKNGLPIGIPRTPHYVYRKEWEGMGVFLGTGYLHTKDWMPLDKAKKYLKKNKINSVEKYQTLFKEKKLPDNLPNSAAIYGIKWSEFLPKQGPVTFDEYKETVKNLDIKDRKGYEEFCRKNTNLNLTSNIIRKFSKEWKGWDDFLGKKNKS